MTDPALLLTVLLAINLITYTLFWYDKRCAKKGGWRISESALLLCALLGGSPAAFFAMRRFRHKTQKNNFRIRYWLIVALQIMGGFWWAISR